MGELSKLMIVGDDKVAYELEKYKKELTELKEQGEIEEIGEIDRRHILMVLDAVIRVTLDNLGEHGRFTLYEDEHKHVYDRAELIYEVMMKLYDNTQTDKVK